MTRQLSWRWHRLRAMDPGEVLLHVRKKLRQSQDKNFVLRNGDLNFTPAGYPVLPRREEAPAVLREKLREERSEILGGRWRAFGRLRLQVDDPPRWSRDYLAGVDLETEQSAFSLNHRELPGGADIKLVWEFSRWHEIVRLAQCAWVFQDEHAASKCLDWLEDWVEHNPPYRGWQWTSGLEVGMRLIAFTWIDALLAEFASDEERVRRLRAKILPAHVRFAWRYQSFGSSANNHLFGELAGIILAVARFPDLEQWAAPMASLQSLWEREVLLQFAPDGGNREQALNYHLYSWEFCWHVRAALLTRNGKISSPVEERLHEAAVFFHALQAPTHPWDYGDSDGAFVIPVFLEPRNCASEWREWMAGLESPGIQYWCGPIPEHLKSKVEPRKDWVLFKDSGYAAFSDEDWRLRFDLSPLGYLATAAHGHLDALHVSIWYRGKPLVIDPGTGTYYADRALRAHLAGWEAHNGPHPPGLEYPRRAGLFLWACSHAQPVVHSPTPGIMRARLDIPGGEMHREVRYLPEQEGWRIEDTVRPASGAARFFVHWQFSPEAILQVVENGRYRLTLGAEAVDILVDAGWSRCETTAPEEALAGVCSRDFCQKEQGPFLRLHWDGHEAAVLSTTILPAESYGH